ADGAADGRRAALVDADEPRVARAVGLARLALAAHRRRYAGIRLRVAQEAAAAVAVGQALHARARADRGLAHRARRAAVVVGQAGGLRIARGRLGDAGVAARADLVRVAAVGGGDALHAGVAARALLADGRGRGAVGGLRGHGADGHAGVAGRALLPRAAL